MDRVDETSDESFPASDPPAWTSVTGSHTELHSELHSEVQSELAGGETTSAHGGGDVELRHNAAARRFEAVSPAGRAELSYRVRTNGVMVFLHTRVPVALAGRGIASRLARMGLEYARDRGIRVVSHCPYVSAYIERHPEFRDLLAP